VTLGSAASSVTFSSIPATYRDLIIVSSFTQSSGSTSGAIRFNGDTGSNYSYVIMSGSGDGTFSNAATSSLIFVPQFNSTADTPVFSTVSVMDYSATDKHKTTLNRDLSTRIDTSRATIAAAVRWANTAAITSLEIFMRAGNFNAGGRFDLYGIAS
jgi:hypothetical protein